MKLLFGGLLVLFLLPFTYATTADLDIYIEPNGLVTVQGTTDYEPFQNIVDSQAYTSKEGEYWIFNISSDEVFSEFTFNLYLPPNSNINYLKTTPSLNIEEEDDRIKLVGTGDNRYFNIVVQYSIDSYLQAEAKENGPYIGGVLLILVLLGFVFLYFYKPGKKEKEDAPQEKKTETQKKVDTSILPERQKEILKILKREGKITQKQLEEKMDIPKSSVSRNLRTLEVKGYIRKERIGQTNYVFLKE